jgi:hypothetical protein
MQGTSQIVQVFATEFKHVSQLNKIVYCLVDFPSIVGTEEL